MTVNRHPIRAARQRSKAAEPTDEVGYCLRQVRACFGVPARAADAAEAWANAKHRHSTRDTTAIPRGVPVFWTGGRAGHGHIAIATGDGDCWSTDILRPGYFDKVRLEEIDLAWGLTLVGWAEDLNGVRVYTPKESK